MKCIFDHKEQWRDSGKHTCYRDHRKEERRKSGNRGKDSKGKEGDSWKNDRMDYHSLHSVPWVKVGKNQSSKARNKRSHFYVD